MGRTYLCWFVFLSNTICNKKAIAEVMHSNFVFHLYSVDYKYTGPCIKCERTFQFNHILQGIVIKTGQSITIKKKSCILAATWLPDLFFSLYLKLDRVQRSGKTNQSWPRMLVSNRVRVFDSTWGEKTFTYTTVFILVVLIKQEILIWLRYGD